MECRIIGSQNSNRKVGRQDCRMAGWQDGRIAGGRLEGNKTGRQNSSRKVGR